MSPTGLHRQGTRKLGGLSRSSTLTRQATMSLSNAGGKRAQALEGLKQQVEDLKTKLQVRQSNHRIHALMLLCDLRHRQASSSCRVVWHSRTPVARLIG